MSKFKTFTLQVPLLRGGQNTTKRWKLFVNTYSIKGYNLEYIKKSQN